MTFPHRSAASLVALCALVGCGRAPEPLIGYAEADYILVAAPVGGRIAEIGVVDGQQVGAGAPLFTLEQESRDDARRAAEARVQAARAQRADLAQGRRPVEIAALKERLAQAEAARELARANLARQRGLVERGFVSAASIDAFHTAFETAHARAAEAARDIDVARLPGRDDALRAADAEVRAAEAELAGADWQVREARQSAPEAGLVADVLRRPGERVAANAPVVSLLSPARIKVKVYVPVARLAEVPVGTQAEAACDGCRAPVPLQVTYVSPQAEYAPPMLYTREQRARLVHLVELRSPVGGAGPLLPGQPVDVRFASAGAPR